jgi:hypothetical protein
MIGLVRVPETESPEEFRFVRTDPVSLLAPALALPPRLSPANICHAQHVSISPVLSRRRKADTAVSVSDAVHDKAGLQLQ